MSIRISIFALLAAFCAARAWAQEPASPDKRWKDSGELTFTSANGNAKSATLGAKNSFEYEGERVGLELIAGGLSSRNNGRLTAEQYNASEKASAKFMERGYWFERVAWDKNSFAGIRSRLDASLGVGYKWFVNPKPNRFRTEIGLGRIDERRIGSADKRFTSGRLYAKFGHDFSETAEVFQDAEYVHNFSSPYDYRINAQTALITAINSHLQLKVSYDWKRSNRPPPGFIKDDTLTSATLIVNF